MFKQSWIGIRAGELNAWGGGAGGIEEVHNAIKEQGDPVRQRSILFRKAFTLSENISRAQIKICGLGVYDLHVNGQKPDERLFFSPVKSEYFKKALYDVFDVTSLLRKGSNALCVELGNGWFATHQKRWGFQMTWYGNPRLTCALEVEYTDGSTVVIASDESWKRNDGPVLFNCIYDGETYDANCEIPGWTEPDYNDADWQFAVFVEAPTQNLIECKAPPVRAARTIEPVSSWALDDLRTVYDFGENWCAVPHVAFSGATGDRITLNFAEEKNEDGTLDATSLRAAKSEDIYILRGGESEAYQPRFTWHGYRYMMLTRSSGSVTILSVKSKPVHSDLAVTGTFQCSDPDINRLHEVILRTQLSCTQGIPIDCPQRDERLPWLGDALVTSQVCLYNYDMRGFYKNWLEDICLDQNPVNGSLPYVSPQPWEGRWETADWAAA
ncbi:MAG: family 78 glycoside hydrolase catalytic domain, partial [Clostridiales bacterium]|nr:family 78 glycoside hydrolase catalytic domain [Clostridiales bacterium]